MSSLSPSPSVPDSPSGSLTPAPSSGDKLDKPLGRPVDTDKHDAIIESATRAFFTQGYSQASIEGIAADAGVSKVTIYNHFGGKSALFKRTVEARCEIIRQRLVVDSGDGPIRERLCDFGFAMTEFLARPEMIRFEISLSAEAEREPQLGAAFLEAGPRRLHAALAGMLDRARQRGELQFADAELAAEHLGSMFKGLSDLERRMRMPIDPEQTSRRIKSAVDLFLRANGAATERSA